MTVNLRAVCCYRSKSEEWTEKWREEDYRARNLVQAIKVGPFKGYSDFYINGKEYRIENTEAGRKFALLYAGWKIANKMKHAGIGEASIIAIPSSSRIDPDSDFVGNRLANAIASYNSAQWTVRSNLYFDAALPKSSAGGGRNAGMIESNLRAADLCGIGAAVLLDDVYTTGAHVIAAANFLRHRGIQVSDAFVVGRTVWEKPADMFDPAVELLYFL